MAVFPALHDQIISQYPYGEQDDFNVVREVLECGRGSAYNWGASTSLPRFAVRAFIVTREEIAIWEDFFASVGGDVGTFEFTDNAGTTYPRCRFDHNTFPLEYVGVNQFSCELTIKVLP